MIRFIYALALLSMTATLSYGNNGIGNASYHSIKVNKGDGVYSILRRYKLLDDPCNLSQFYKINDLNKNASLKVDQEYLLPVLIYKYNGTSIRSTLGISDLQKAIRIKSYNEEVRKAKLRNLNFIESKILWVPFHELNCGNDQTTTAPSTTDNPLKVKTSSKATEAKSTVETEKKTVEIETNQAKVAPKKAPIATKKSGLKSINVPLFGDKYSKVTIESNELKNHVYYIVSGHGGPDPGAQCLDCESVLCEDEYAYDVSLRLARNLMSKGANVHVIIQDNDGIRDDRLLKCDTDETCLGKLKLPRNQKLRLLQRVSAINDLYKVYKKRGIKNQKTLSIHIDSNTKNKKMDAYFCYYHKSKPSKKLATDLKNKFAEKYDYYQKDRGYYGKISPRRFYILKNTAAPAVLVELANIKNANNQKRFVRPDNRQALADWLFEGLSGVSL